MDQNLRSVIRPSIIRDLMTSSGTYTNDERTSLHIPAAKLNRGFSFLTLHLSPRLLTPSYPIKKSDLEGIAANRTIPTPEKRALRPSIK